MGRVRFIKLAQELGFTLAEVSELLALPDGAGRPRSEVHAVAAARIAAIHAKIRQLAAVRTALAGLVEACEGENDTVECPIIEALEVSGSTSLARRPNEQRRG